jgi:NB-ARC domain
MDQSLVGGASVVLGALFAETLRKVGDTLTSAATTAAADKVADQVAELVGHWLGPDHPLTAALEAARERPGEHQRPAGLDAAIRRLAEDPQFALELRRLLEPPDPPPNVTVNARTIKQRGDVNVVGQAKITTHSISGPDTRPPDLTAGPLSDAVAGTVIQQGTIVVAGHAEINIIRGPAEPARQLEAVRGFVGREAELRWLRRELRARPGMAPLVVISGEPGVGKTDLALVIANRLAGDDYPDLQLQIRLTGSPQAAGDILLGVLLALGQGPADIPDGEADRVNRYLSLLNGKRALVVIDDASDHPVRMLLPPQGCATIVTTGATLRGLHEKGAKSLRLGRLPRRQALTLVAARIGWARVARQPWGAAQLVDACDRLPQALVILAAHLASPAEPHTRLRRVARDLRRQPLQPGSRLRGLDAAFAVSYQQLPDQQRHTFQLLGLLNTTEIDTAALAEAAAIDLHEAERRLKALANANLIERRSGRWRLRPLVLGYARVRADQDLSEPARSAAIQRALTYQLRQVRDQRRRIAKAAELDPATAAQLQADLDRELARGAALVDAAVGQALDLLDVSGGELADVLHEVISAWPDPARARRGRVGESGVTAPAG